MFKNTGTEQQEEENCKSLKKFKTADTRSLFYENGHVQVFIQRPKSG
jgi:hypothetical protein